MKRIFISMALFLVIALGTVALLSPAPEAAPQCVDPNLCPIVICPPDWTFVDTTCKECQHCEPPDNGKPGKGGKGKGKPGGSSDPG